MDRSSFIREGQRKRGTAVSIEMEVIWAWSLSPGTSAQKAELIALSQALIMGKGLIVNIYTNSWYAFATTHIHGAIYQERGLLTAEGKTIKNKDEILQLLEALWLPMRMAIIHCPGHQKGTTAVTRGKNLAHRAAKEAALEETAASVLAATLPEPPDPNLQECPAYTEEEVK